MRTNIKENKELVGKCGKMEEEYEEYKKEVKDKERKIKLRQEN